MSLPKFYYFDNNATTPVAPEVIDAMLPLFSHYWANPSSGYQLAQQVASQLERARSKVAELINADPRELIFTSCGTESINSAMHGALRSQPERRHLLCTAVEHSATLKYAEDLERTGYLVTYLPVEPDGSLDLHLVERSIRPDTALVSVMWANNETGLLFPIPEIAEICRGKGVLFHTDAVQAAGKVPLDVKEAGVDFLSLSAHKLRAPKGIGLLYVKRRTKFHPYIIGGSQERGRRGGTENTALIVAFGRAAELALTNLTREATVIRAWRDRVEKTVLSTVPGVARNGAEEPRLPNTTNLAFEGIEAEALLIRLDQMGICASSGSACTTGSLEPSHVLKAMGMSAARARGSIRLSLGIDNTEEDVEYLLKHLPRAVASLRPPSARTTEDRAEQGTPR